MRTWGMAGVCIVAAQALSGCSGPVACPAIAYSSTIPVELSGAVQRVHTVEVCSDAGCTSVLGRRASAGGGASTAHVFMPVNSAAPTPPPDSSPFGEAAQLDEDSWVIHVYGTLPNRVTARALDTEDAVLAEDQFALQWTRVGGTEECGGPFESNTITLDIGS